MIGDRLFYYSGSANRPPGDGIHESVQDKTEYTVLCVTPDWRKMLSNFWVADFVINGKTYRTVEHCFQAAKIALADENLAGSFSLESGSILAKGDGGTARRARKLVLLSDKQLSEWDAVKHRVMQAAMRAKFEQHADLAKVLLATGAAELWHRAGRGQQPQRVYDLEGVREELR